MAETKETTAAAAETSTKSSTPTSTVTPSSSTTTTTNYWIVASYVTIAGLWVASQFVLIPYTVHVLVLVTAILYPACHHSITLLHHPTTIEEVVIDKDGKEVTITTPVEQRETLRKEDALQFPIVGSISLFGLYLAFKFLGKEWVNYLIGAYFGVIGCVAVAATISPVLNALAPMASFKADIRYETKLTHPFEQGGIVDQYILPKETSMTVTFSVMDVLGMALAATVVALYFQSKPWYLNNVLGICFCLQGIQRLSLGTYKIGAILLIGLFFYDIFWVFGTDVMVTVAKSLDGPIKLLFPRSFEISEETGKLKDMSLLGLGDIVLPGFFLALLLRFDAHKAATADGKAGAPMHVHDSFAKPYFHTALIAYVLGLGTTLFVMIQFNAAQPALLYLVPACLGSSFLCAIVRGEVKELLDYSEEEEEEEDDEGEEGKGEDKKKDQEAKKDD